MHALNFMAINHKPAEIFYQIIWWTMWPVVRVWGFTKHVRVHHLGILNFCQYNQWEDISVWTKVVDKLTCELFVLWEKNAKRCIKRMRWRKKMKGQAERKHHAEKRSEIVQSCFIMLKLWNISLNLNTAEVRPCFSGGGDSTGGAADRSLTLTKVQCCEVTISSLKSFNTIPLFLLPLLNRSLPEQKNGVWSLLSVSVSF